jgi:hypothetical protein
MHFPAPGVTIEVAQRRAGKTLRDHVRTHSEKTLIQQAKAPFHHAVNGVFLFKTPSNGRLQFLAGKQSEYQ